MTIAAPRRRSRYLYLIGGVVGSIAATPVSAQSLEGRVRTSAGAGYNSNPYLLRGGSTDAGSVDAEVRPSIDLVEQRGRLGAEVYYRRKEFFHRYSGTDAYGGSLAGNYRFSEVTTLTGLVVYSNAIVDASNLFETGILGTTTGPTDPSAPVPANPVGVPLPGSGLIDPISGDVGLIGLRQRRSELNANADLAIRPNQTDTWTLSLLGRKANYPGSNVAASYSSYGAAAGYARALSSTSTLGGTGTFLIVKSSGSSQSTRIYSPQLTYAIRFENNWSVEASGGVSIVDGDRGLGSGSKISSAFQLNACSEGLRSKFCLIGTRAASPSGTNRVNVQTTVRASYEHKFSQRSAVNADASYNSISRPALGTLYTAQNFVAADVGYRAPLTRRLQWSAQVNYQRRDAKNASALSDIAGRVGLIATWGDRDDR